MVWILYNLLFALGFALLLPKFLLRMLKRGGYRQDFMQRFGLYDGRLLQQLNTQVRPIWIHAVSVGELFVALQLMAALRERRSHVRFVLSVTTSTAHRIASERMNPSDALIYFPLDFPVVMRRVLRMLRPQHIVLVECEFWPNLVRYSHRLGIPVSLVNGRLSDSSFNGYRRLGMFSRRIMPLISPVCMQGARDAERIRDLGARAEQVHVLGSAKYEIDAPSAEAQAEAARALREAGLPEASTILLGGSTWAGEEEILLRVYAVLRQHHPRLRLVLVPRHAERTPEVLRLIEQFGLTVARRSQKDAQTLEGGPDVYLLDTTGELMKFYSQASIIFVGKSLTQNGGQNPIEPALLAKPVIVGPNMENFPVVMQDFVEAKALIQVRDEAGLRESINRLLEDEPLRLDYGRRAGELVRAKRGAIRKTVELLLGV